MSSIIDFEILFEKNGLARYNWNSGGSFYHATDRIEFLASIQQHGFQLISTGNYGTAVSFALEEDGTKPYGHLVVKATFNRSVNILSIDDDIVFEINNNLHIAHKVAAKYGVDGIYDALAGGLFMFNTDCIDILQCYERNSDFCISNLPAVDLEKIIAINQSMEYLSYG